MKKTVKSLVAVATALVLGSAAFAETSLSFYDKVSSDLVTFGSVTTDVNGNKTTAKKDADFAGITNRVNAEFKSDRVDAGVDIAFTFDNENKGASLVGFDVKDYYVEFRPVEILTLGFSDVINATGSYLPILDDNIATGNFGSDFVLCVRPIEGLRIAGGIDFDSYFGVDGHKPILNFGADYANDAFAIGASFRDVADDADNGFDFGVYGSLTAVDGLTLNLGYTRLGGGLLITGDNVLSLGATFVALDEALTLNLDFETNFGAENSKFLYVALNPEYQITDALDAGIVCSVVFGNNADTEYDLEINPYVDYAIGNHHFGIGFDAKIGVAGWDATKTTTTDTTFGIPVYYKYAF